MEKVELGELEKYLSEELLLKTNIFDFLTQDIIDDFNEVLTTKNPSHRENYKREWDYAKFETNNGNYFRTESIFNAAYVNPEFDNLMTTVFFKKDDVEYGIRTVIENNRKIILIKDDKSHMLEYENEDGQIKIKEANGPFKFIEQNAEGDNEQV